MKTSRRIQKTLTRVGLHEATTDFGFWQTQSYQARIAALEEIRREFHRWKYGAEPRLQRATPPGVDFETCYSSRVEVVIDDVTVNFIDLENLKKSKKAAGRLQDLADLENLQ